MPKSDDNNAMRLDKWLWCARFFKTRSQAAEAIKSGKIKINGERAKPAKLIEEDDKLTIKKGPYEYNVTVINLSKNRLSATLAAELYLEDDDSLLKRQELNKLIQSEAKLYPRTSGRPTKRDRRQIIRFKTEGNSK